MKEQKLNLQQLQDLIKKIPPKTKEAYYAVSTAESIYEARQANGIPDHLAGKIAAEIANIMLGLLSPADLTHKLMDIGIPEAAAANFYRLISQSLLLKIKDELNQMYNPVPTNPEKEISAPSPGPYQTQPEPLQQEKNIVRVKVEVPPLRRVNVHHFEEEATIKGATEPRQTQTEPPQTQSEPIQAQQVQPKINDPYREKLDGA